jgi:hypothetical protein
MNLSLLRAGHARIRDREVRPTANPADRECGDALACPVTLCVAVDYMAVAVRCCGWCVSSSASWLRHFARHRVRESEHAIGEQCDPEEGWHEPHAVAWRLASRPGQYVSIRYSERLMDVGAAASVGSVADS